MDKDVIHTQPTHTMAHYSAMKKDEILPFATTTQMDAVGIIITIIREKQALYNITYMWTPKHKTNKHNTTEMDPQTQRTVWWLLEGKWVGNK